MQCPGRVLEPVLVVGGCKGRDLQRLQRLEVGTDGIFDRDAIDLKILKTLGYQKIPVVIDFEQCRDTGTGVVNRIEVLLRRREIVDLRCARQGAAARAGRQTVGTDAAHRWY